MTKTPQELVAEIRKLTEQLAELTGNKTSDTNEPIIYGNGLFDVRQAGDGMRIALSTDFGWVSTFFPPAIGAAFAGQINATAIAALSSKMSSGEVTEVPKIDVH